MAVRTRFFIISDTHGHDDVVAEKSLAQQTDVVIHCGDLTEEAKIGEFHKTLQLLRRLRAPLKLVIAGNHDLTLDEPTFQQRVAESPDLLEPELVQKTFGPPGAPRRLLEQARDEGIHFLSFTPSSLAYAYTSSSMSQSFNKRHARGSLKKG